MSEYLIREDYLAKLRPHYEDNLIKVIYGVRGCGKSTLLKEVEDEIRLNGVGNDHIISISLKNGSFKGIKTYRGLYKYINTLTIDNDKYYIFIDNIEYIKSYPLVLLRLKQEINCSIFIVANPNCLNEEDCFKVKLYPFSFKEAYEYKQMIGEDISPYEFIGDYLSWGGYPERFKYGDNYDDVRDCLEEIYKDIINKDVIDKKNEMNKERLINVVNYILSSSENHLKTTAITDYFKKEYNDTFDKKVLYNYLNKMEQACLISRVPRFDIKGKNLMKYIEKDYVVDTGLRRINTPSTRIQDTNFLENLIYNELVNRGYKVYVGKTYKGEVDFVVTKLNKKCYIQVAYVLASPEIIQREFDAFNPIKDACPKYVLSLDRWDFSGDGICNINIVDFLLGKRDILLT